MPSRIEIIEEDITRLGVDAIVNATNLSLKPDSPIEHTIHAKAGPKLAAECVHVSPCPVGETRITRGYNLLSKFVIHVVDPIWGGGEAGEDMLLANCYKNIFELAVSFEVRTIALPPLSSGAKGYPPLRSSHIAMQEIILFLEENESVKTIVLCCPEEQAVQSFEAAFDKCTA